MAAVRCAARKLGCSLLQRTQAAVMQEGRLLAPSRLMRSRQLSSEASSEEKKVELRKLVSKAMQKRVELLGEPEMRLLLQRISLPKGTPKPHATPWTWGRFATRTKCYMEAAANLTVFLAVTAYVVCVKGDRGVQEQVQGVNEENQ
ncbi:hypothetical protein TRIUR3_03955 [Triticum urartu]|uniref:Uncharacterized protein n=1 Tax=Triticum urartu TaxID=4572 RepID=M7ZMP3_TRIUA|nr:hypothetical protein TRIUR3_03955 [Triticum urartu]